ncbi:MAG: hypothetical protein R3338_08675, partial [Thermoanaerobaculia bacterium]|nr:hypothetical protein [Thermoanaerobaculia bacterium]
MKISHGCLVILMTMLAGTAGAYPEFEVWVENTSGRYIDCAMCHTHPDGPEGRKRLTQDEIRELVKYMRRAAANVLVEALDHPLD